MTDHSRLGNVTRSNDCQGKGLGGARELHAQGKSGASNEIGSKVLIIKTCASNCTGQFSRKRSFKMFLLATRIMRNQARQPLAAPLRQLVLHSVVRGFSSATGAGGKSDLSQRYHRTVKLPDGRTLAWADVIVKLVKK
jgi:hypothetical protein